MPTSPQGRARLRSAGKWLGVLLAVAGLGVSCLGFAQDNLVDMAQVWGTGLAVLLAGVGLSRWSVQPRQNRDGLPDTTRRPIRNAPSPWHDASLVTRPEIVDRAIGALTSEAGPVALAGPGGNGKTVCAYLVAQHETIADAFPGGVLWIDLNEAAVDTRLAQIIDEHSLRLSGERPNSVNSDFAAQFLLSTISGANTLLIVDDVWHESQVRPFLRLSGGKTKLLVTTRLQNIAGVPYNVAVDVMSRRDSLDLLLQHGGPPAEGSLAAIVDYADGWPLLLALVRGEMTVYTRNGLTPEDAVAEVQRRLDLSGPTTLDKSSSGYRAEAVGTTIEATLRFLSAHAGQSGAELVRIYRAFAIIPVDTAVGPEPLSRLIAASLDRSEPATSAECASVGRRLSDYSLIDYSAGSNVLRLHRVVAMYLQGDGTRIRTNEAFLARYAEAVPHDAQDRPQWWRLATSDSYMWDNLGHHLELSDHARWNDGWPMCSTEWVQHRIVEFGSAALESDLSRVLRPEADVIRTAVTRNASMLEPISPRRGIVDTLLGCIPAAERAAVSDLLDQGRPYDQAQRLFLNDKQTFPSTAALIRSFYTTPRSAITSIAVAADSTDIVVGDARGTIWVWDYSSGALKHKLKTRGDSLPTLQPSSLRSLVNDPSDLADFLLMTMAIRRPYNRDAAGKPLVDYTSDPSAVQNMTFMADSNCVAFQNASEFVRVFDVAAGQERMRGRLDDVQQVVFSADGLSFLTSDMRGRLELWELRRRGPRRVMRVRAGGDHPLLVAASRDLSRVFTVGESGFDNSVLLRWQVIRRTGRFSGRVRHRLRQQAMTVVPGSFIGGLWIGERGLSLAVSRDDKLELRSGDTLTPWTQFPVDEEIKLAGAAFAETDLSRAVLVEADGLVTLVRQGRAGTNLGRQPGGVSAFAQDPGDQWLATGGRDGTLSLWALPAEPDPPATVPTVDVANHAALAPDRVVCAESDGYLRIRDALTAECVAEQTTGSPHLFSTKPARSGGVIAACGSDGAVYVWDSALNLRRRLDLRENQVHEILDVESDGSVLALGFDQVCRVGPDGGVVTREVAIYKNPLSSWHHAGGTFFTAQFGGELKAWSSRTLELIAETALESPVEQMMVSPTTGFLYAVDADGEMQCLDMLSLRPSGRSVQVGSGSVTSAALVSSGDALLGTELGELIMLNLGARRITWREHRHEGAVRTISVADSKAWIATSGDDSLVRVGGIDGGVLAAVRLPGRLNTLTWHGFDTTVFGAGYSGTYALRYSAGAQPDPGRA